MRPDTAQTLMMRLLTCSILITAKISVSSSVPLSQSTLIGLSLTAVTELCPHISVDQTMRCWLAAGIQSEASHLLLSHLL